MGVQEIKNMGIHRSFQIPQIFDSLTVIENVVISNLVAFGKQNNYFVIVRTIGISLKKTIIPPCVLVLFLGLMFIGGCAGSTTCGIKIFRFQILYSFITNQLKKIIYPKGIFVLKYDQNQIDNKFIASIISFIYMYLVIFFLLSALLSLTGLDFITAISGAATSISNVGPGLGSIIGPNGNFSTLPDVSKWILTIGMILGRLELFAILVLFLPSFWRN